MPKIVVLGSCRFEPYEFLAVPNKIPGLWNTEDGYKKAAEKFYPAMDACDEVWLYAPDGIGEHTFRDLEYALSKHKSVKIIAPEHVTTSKLQTLLRIHNLKSSVQSHNNGGKTE